MRTPALLLDERYHLSPDDFPERFHRIVFGAFDHLAHKGIQSIDEIVVDDYLSRFPTQYHVFTENRGVDYLHHLATVSQDVNFDYYYNTLKKCSLLNALEQQGFNISPFYDPSEVSPSACDKTEERMTESTQDEILEHYELQLSKIKSQFTTKSDVVEVHAAKGMRELRQRLREEPEFGLPMNSAKMTTICHGRRLKKFYLKTSPTGFGKTRLAVADACLLGIPERYNPQLDRWEQITTTARGVVFITTELEVDEIQTMIWAYTAGVPENHITDNCYAPGESERVDHAIELVERSNFHIIYISQFDMDDIEHLVKQAKLDYGCDYIFFDYLSTSAKALAGLSQKTRGFSLREDQLLVLFSDRLKTLCNRYNVHIDTSTQANDDWKNQASPDQSVIRGSKAIADKIDVGYVSTELSEKDKVAMETLLAQGAKFCQMPNLVFNIYKVRRGAYNHIKLFVYFDYATLRTTDICATDRNYKVLDIQGTNIESILNKTIIEEVPSLLEAPHEVVEQPTELPEPLDW